MRKPGAMGEKAKWPRNEALEVARDGRQHAIVLDLHSNDNPPTTPPNE
jgi:hypothetical protein